MRLLDLFSGAGGAAVGYSRAGFEVTGVDHVTQPRYPFEFIQADALEYVAEHGHEYDAIHASPPCQAYVDSANKGKHPRLIEPIRLLCQQVGQPFVIENVDTAPVFNWVMLCGTMFGLRVIRHRHFECSWGIPWPPYSCCHWGKVQDGDFAGVYGLGARGPRYSDENGRQRRGAVPNGRLMTFWSDAMGIDWMKRKELTQAIPPAYTEYIGEALVGALRRAGEPQETGG